MGLKTGSTSLAKYCVSEVAKRNGITLISVVMTAPDYKVRFKDAAAMLNLDVYKRQTMGGQEGDKGVIELGDAQFVVEDTIKLRGGKVGHVGRLTKGMLKTGDVVTLKVSAKDRADTCKNHSATHLLQKALKTVLGSHVEQKGSLVTPDRCV